MMKKVLLPLALALASCGGGARVVKINLVSVAFDRDPGALPFDPNSPRLVAASDELAKRAAHAVTIAIDPALLPQFSGRMELELANAIEGAARAITTLGRTHPIALPRETRVFNGVAFHYAPAADVVSATMDAVTGMIEVNMPSRAESLTVDPGIYDALDRDYAEYAERTYARVDPENIKPKQIDEYADWVHRPPPGKFDPGWMWPRIEKAARFEPRIWQKPEIDAKVRRWLVDQGRTIARAFRSPPAGVSQLAWHRAEASWVEWLNVSIDHLSGAERAEVLDAVLVKRLERKEGESELDHHAFMGFDVTAFGIGTMKEWAKAGHPRDEKASNDGPLYARLLCLDDRSSTCERPWITYVMEDAGAERHAVEALLRTADRDLSRAFLRGAVSASSPDVARLFRHASADADLFTVMTTELVERWPSLGLAGPTFYEETRNAWLTHPDPAARGLLLRLLLAIDRTGTAVLWDRFAQNFGGALGAAELGALFNQEVLALAAVPRLRRAFGDFSRAKLFVGHLDAFLDDPRSNRATIGSGAPLHDLVHVLCDEHRIDEIAELHAYFEKRVKEHVADEKRLSEVITDTAPAAAKKCVAPPKPKGGSAPKLVDPKDQGPDRQAPSYDGNSPTGPK